MPTRARATRWRLPSTGDVATVRLRGRAVKLTNLDKVFWPEAGITKRDLLAYYVAVAPALLPHVADRAMVMKRYPNGIRGKCFFMKRTPTSAPTWLRRCTIQHNAGPIDFPMVQDLPSLLWLVNLGCIDLNQWYARCDDTGRPDYLNFDLDPGPRVPFARVRETALLVREALGAMGMTPLVKTTGASGMHLYVPLVRGPEQKAVWRVAKRIAQDLERRHPKLITAAYRIADRPPGRVLVDYNQNAWGRTLASVYSVRPTPGATVSTPVTWAEVEGGIEIDQFRIDNVPARVRQLGDLWQPLLQARGRFRLEAAR